MSEHTNNFPKLHNAAWPGIVGKGPDAEEPAIDLDTMLDLTAAAEVDGVKFDGVDLFLFSPHVAIDSTDDDLKQLAEKVQSRHLVIGSVVAPIWPPTGGGSAMGGPEDRKKFVGQVHKGCLKIEKSSSGRFTKVAISPGRCASSVFDPAASCGLTPRSTRAVGRPIPTATRRRLPGH